MDNLDIQGDASESLILMSKCPETCRMAGRKWTVCHLEGPPSCQSLVEWEMGSSRECLGTALYTTERLNGRTSHVTFSVRSSNRNTRPKSLRVRRQEPAPFLTRQQQPLSPHWTPTQGGKRPPLLSKSAKSSPLVASTTTESWSPAKANSCGNSLWKGRVVSKQKADGEALPLGSCIRESQEPRGMLSPALWYQASPIPTRGGKRRWCKPS